MAKYPDWSHHQKVRYTRKQKKLEREAEDRKLRELEQRLLERRKTESKFRYKNGVIVPNKYFGFPPYSNKPDTDAGKSYLPPLNENTSI
jgi:hypothetical protein